VHFRPSRETRTDGKGLDRAPASSFCLSANRPLYRELLISRWLGPAKRLRQAPTSREAPTTVLRTAGKQIQPPLRFFDFGEYVERHRHVASHEFTEGFLSGCRSSSFGKQLSVPSGQQWLNEPFMTISRYLYRARGQ